MSLLEISFLIRPSTYCMESSIRDIQRQLVQNKQPRINIAKRFAALSPTKLCRLDAGQIVADSCNCPQALLFREEPCSRRHVG